MTQQRVLEQWWAELDQDGRTRALALRPGQHLPAALAAHLRRRGVQVPEARVAWDVQGVQDCLTVHVQPRALSDFLVRVRSVPAVVN